MTVFGISVWWLLGGCGLLFASVLAGCWVVQEWAPTTTRKQVADWWAKALADQGPIDAQQRADLLSGESALEDPAVLKSVNRARRRGRLGGTS